MDNDDWLGICWVLSMLMRSCGWFSLGIFGFPDFLGFGVNASREGPAFEIRGY